VLIFFVLASYCSAGLIFSEDFESYTPFIEPYNNTQRENFFAEADNLWKCSDTERIPLCTTFGGTNWDAGPNNWSIQQEGENRYLNLLSSIRPDGKGYWTTSLSWLNWTQNLTWQPGNYIAVQYRMRVHGAACYDYTRDLDKCYAGVYEQLVHYDISGKYGMTNVGGVWTYNWTNFSSVRPIMQSGYMIPQKWNTKCSIGDGYWHNVTRIYQVNGSCYVTNTTIYIDGELCDYTDEYISGHLCDSDAIYMLIVRSHRGWNIDFDDLELHQNVSTDLEIVDIIPIQVIPDVPMVRGKSGYVRVIARNNGPSEVGPYGYGTVRAWFDGHELDAVGSATKSMPLYQNVSFDFILEADDIDTAGTVVVNASLEVGR